MLDTLEILKACFSELKRTYEVVLADSIPGVSKIDYVQTWKVTTEAIYKEKLCIIELFLGFNVDFPYSLPDIYLPSAEFKYIPHRSFLTGKLCLAPDDCCYDIDDCSRLIKSCIYGGVVYCHHWVPRHGVGACVGVRKVYAAAV